MNANLEFASFARLAECLTPLARPGGHHWGVERTAYTDYIL